MSRTDFSRWIQKAPDEHEHRDQEQAHDEAMPDPVHRKSQNCSPSAFKNSPGFVRSKPISGASAQLVARVSRPSTGDCKLITESNMGSEYTRSRERLRGPFLKLKIALRL